MIGGVKFSFFQISQWVLLTCILAFPALSVFAEESEDSDRSRLVFPPGQSRPAATPPPGEANPNPRERIDAFFHLLARENVDEAYDNLVKGSIIAESKEDVDALKERSRRALDAYGPIRHYEVLNEMAVGSSLRRTTCLSLNEDLPLRWRFYFYNSAKGWKLVDLRVDDGLVELFEEAGTPLNPASPR